MNIPHIPKAIILIFTTEVHLGPAWGDGAQPAIAAVMRDAGVHDLAAAEAEPACFPVARAAPLLPVMLIVLLLRPGILTPEHAR
jgi:hypothetical protein